MKISEKAGAYITCLILLLPLRLLAAVPHDPGMEARVAKLESDVGHIRTDIAEMKASLGRLAPRIDEMHGFVTGLLPTLATKADLSKVEGALGLEIVKRPTRRQSIVDIITFVTLITGLMTFGGHLAH